MSDVIIGLIVIGAIIWYTVYEMLEEAKKDKYKEQHNFDVMKTINATSKGHNFAVPRINYKEKQEYLQSEAWQKLSNTIRVQSDFTCAKCGNWGVETHHLHYVNFEHEPLSDLVCLCRDCHQSIHDKYGYYNKEDNYPIT